MIVADTDVLIDFLTGAEPGADLVAGHLGKGALWTTVVTSYELLAGARTDDQLDIIRQLLNALPALPLEEGGVEKAAGIHRELAARGEVIGMADGLIAGIVLHQGAVLLTRNRKHFERVSELRLILVSDK
jgi:tRNA(fMet)-specific endonuclease VapC